MDAKKTSVFRRLRSYFRKHSMMFAIFASITLLVTVISLSLIGFLSVRLSDALADRENKTIELLTRQAFSAVSAQFDATFDEYLRMSRYNGRVQDALHGGELSPIDAMHACNEIGARVEFNSIVKSVYIYNAKIDTFITTYTARSRGDAFYDQDALRTLRSFEDGGNIQIVPRHVTYRVHDKLYDERFISLFFLTHDAARMIDSALVVNIDERMLRTAMSLPDQDETIGIQIVNAHGQVLSASEASAIGAYINDEAYYQQIANLAQVSGTVETEIDGILSQIRYITSQRGYTLMVLTDAYHYQQAIDEIVRSALLVSAAFALLGIFLSMVASAYLYSPYLRIKNMIRRQGIDATDEEGEVVGIVHALDAVFDNMHTLSESNRNLVNVRKTDLLRQLVRGLLPIDESTRESMEAVGMQTDMP